jgi:two-component system osmolarity sensor histidine kinase EnvZ
MMIKRYLPKGLFGRTFLIVMLPVLLLQITASIVFFERHWSKMTERLAFAVAGEIAAISGEVERATNNDEPLDDIQRLVLNHLDLQMMFVENVESLPLRSVGDAHIISNDLDIILNNKIKDPYQLSVFKSNKQVFVDILLSAGLLTIIVPEGRLFSSSSYIFILWMIGLSLLFFTIAMIFMRNQIRPIYRLGLVAERLGRGIPVEKIKPSGASEVRQAAEAFIRMQDRIKHFIEQRTVMLAGVSHDLRTPLTRMKLQLELLGDDADTKAIKEDIQDMEAMIEGYLSFAKGDAGEPIQKLSLTKIIDKEIEDARRIGLVVTDHRNNYDDFTIWAKPMALTRVFDNIIGNSGRHASQLSVSVKEQDKTITVVLEDDGEGIPLEQRQDVLKPFVRGDVSRNKKTGGVGLGLTIANDIMASHGGTLELGASEKLGGLKVTLNLPL